MPAYVLLSKLSTDGMRQILAEPDKLRGVRRILEEYEANILALEGFQRVKDDMSLARRSQQECSRLSSLENRPPRKL